MKEKIYEMFTPTSHSSVPNTPYLEVSIVWGTHFGPWHGTTRHCSRLGRHGPKGAGCARPKETTYAAYHAGPLDPFKFHFLLFTFYYRSNVYNTPLNNYITISLMGKKLN